MTDHPDSREQSRRDFEATLYPQGHAFRQGVKAAWRAWQASEARMQAKVEALEEQLVQREAQVTVLVALMPQFRPKFGAVGSRDVDVATQQQAFDKAVLFAQPSQALAAHDKQVEAAALRRAAEACREVAARYPIEVFPDDGKSKDCDSARMARLTASNCISAINEMADAIEREGK